MVKPITWAIGSIVDLEQKKKASTEEGQQTEHKTQKWVIIYVRMLTI